MIEKEPFRLYDDSQGEKPDIFTVRLNTEERERLNRAKVRLEQPKDSTALKTLADIGYIVIHDELIGLILDRVFTNLTNNFRTGSYVETPTSDTNVIPKSGA